MNNKFYNYLYDYLISKDLMKDKHPKDQKEKMEFAKDYIQRLMKVHKVYSDRDSDMLKNMYLNRYVIKYENIPDSYWKAQERMYLERGMGHHTMSDSEKRQLSDTIIKDQTKSLENILDYFFSEDAKFYPDDLKFWAFQGLLQLGTYHKDTNLFDKRTKSTVAPFIDINREALALSINEMNNFINNSNVSNKDLLEEIFKGNLNKSFSTLYTFYLKQANANKKSKIVSDDGIWIKYDQGTDHMKLVRTLVGKGTGWCTAGESMAKSQLENGDFYVYYTKGETDEYTEPRIAIRMDGTDKIGEIRGIAANQHIETNMEQVLDKKLEEFPNKDKYKKKVSDMEKLTIIYNKYKKEEELSNEELRFLYEIDNQIEGFGHKKDPRIQEIINTRDMKEDLSKALNCSKEEIGIEPEKLGDTPLKYYHGNIKYLSTFTNLDNIILPEIVNGNLDLSNLNNVDGLILPKIVSGSLDLRSLDLSSLTSTKKHKLPNFIGGTLFFKSLTSAKEELKLPDSVGGDLYLNSLTSAEGLTLPNYVGGSLDLHRLTSADGLKLPDSIGGSLDLYRLTSANGLKLPDSIEGSLDLHRLTSVDGLKLPNSIGGTLYLNGLTSANGLKLPNSVGGLYLGSLTSADGLKLPNSIRGDLCLNGLTKIDGLKLPNSIGGTLYLNGLTSADGLTLPNSIGGTLYLNGLTSADGLSLPNSIGETLYLNGLTSADGLKLPNSIGSDIKGALYLNGLTSANGLSLPNVRSIYLGNLTSADGLSLPNSIIIELVLSQLTDLNSLIFPPEFWCLGMRLEKIGFVGNSEELKIFMSNNKNKNDSHISSNKLSFKEKYEELKIFMNNNKNKKR